jgi:hypothetical protein
MALLRRPPAATTATTTTKATKATKATTATTTTKATKATTAARAAATIAALASAAILAGCGTDARAARPAPRRPQTVTVTASGAPSPTAASPPAQTAAGPAAQPPSDWLPPGVELPHPPGATAQSIMASGVFGGWRYPVNAVRAFALLYANWTAASVVVHLKTLALFTVDQARSLVELQAAETGSDYELQRGGIANSATVESIAPAPGVPDDWIVVTRERTTSTRTLAYQGLAPAWHVSLASVTQVRGLWVVSRWQSES